MEDPAIGMLIRTGDTRRFYASPSWRKLRREALERDRHACIHCKDKGKYTKASTVHHIQEIKTAPHLALTLSNLTSLCQPCHEAIHPRNTPSSKQAAHTWPERW
jgi:5-methylcytosine-specific restriction endonuclease McrA